MCTTCGCSDHNNVTMTHLPGRLARDAQDGPLHFRKISPVGDAVTVVPTHSHGEHTHLHFNKDAGTIRLEAEILSKNDGLAKQNRDWLQAQNILALNLVSSPGSGKTTLLERSIRDLEDEMNLSVIEGDQQTLLDAERIQATGCNVVQLNTGAGCHLEADMLARGLEKLNPAPHSVVMIENVGNLVCPALFDLGEYAKVAILSVTEGEDKPLKYPHMFRAASLMVLNKVDLLPYVNFDVQRCREYAKQVNPDIEVITVSATTGEGLQGWYDWIRTAIDSRPFKGSQSRTSQELHS